MTIQTYQEVTLQTTKLNDTGLNTAITMSPLKIVGTFCRPIVKLNKT